MGKNSLRRFIARLIALRRSAAQRTRVALVLERQRRQERSARWGAAMALRGSKLEAGAALAAVVPARALWSGVSVALGISILLCVIWPAMGWSIVASLRRKLAQRFESLRASRANLWCWRMEATMEDRFDTYSGLAESAAEKLAKWACWALPPISWWVSWEGALGAALSLNPSMAPSSWAFRCLGSNPFVWAQVAKAAAPSLKADGSSGVVGGWTLWNKAGLSHWASRPVGFYGALAMARKPWSRPIDDISKGLACYPSPYGDPARHWLRRVQCGKEAFELSAALQECSGAPGRGKGPSRL